MTGDGVNDAPALKKADCGIAVSGATDAARAAAAIVLMTPGLSVIIEAIKESRKIFQRMNSYAIYRIAETLRVLFFMTLAILVFNFYPLTAVMIVMLALLNDGAILSIAYDRVHYRNAPEAWNMRVVLGVSTVLGVLGVIAAFGLFFLAERVFHIDRAHIQTMMYLKLSVAGHLTIFLTRTRGPFRSIRPARILWGAVIGTQALATCIALFGFGLVTPLAWYWALLVWGWALAWFLVNDRFKLLAYSVLDRMNISEAKGAVAPQPQVSAASASDADDGKADAKAGPSPAAALPPPAASVPKPGSQASGSPQLQPAHAAAPAPPGKPVPPAVADYAGAAAPSVAALLDMKLGDVLLAGVLKHPEQAGHLITDAIAEAEAAAPGKPEDKPTEPAVPQPVAPE